MDKQELLATMRRWDACSPATHYVIEHASDDAAEIISTCTCVNWLIWLLGRERRLARFVNVCAKRAKRHGHAAHAAYAAYAADAAAAAERAAQLKGLQRIGRAWANGEAAEVV